MEVPQKARNKNYPINPTTKHPEKVKILKETCTPMFTEALFTIAQTSEQPRYPSTDEWIKKV